MLGFIDGQPVKSEVNVKTQISYTKLDGETGVTLVNGTISDTLQAKRELAAKLDLAAGNTPDAEHEDIDSRLRSHGVDSNSVQHLHLSE